MAKLENIANALIAGKRDEVVNAVKQALSEGVSAGSVLNDGLVAGMSVVGMRFRNNEIYVPEVLIAARAMKGGMEILEPLLKKEGVSRIGTVVVGTVKGDLHDIGKNLVCMMLQGGGFEVVDIGTDVTAEKFVNAAKEKNAAVIGMSALLTTTMPYMAEVIKAVKDAGLKVRTMIGGAPVTEKFAEEINADGYAPDAASAVDIARKLIKAA